MFGQIAVVMGISFLLQTVITNVFGDYSSGDDSGNAAAKQGGAQKKFSYEDAVEQQQRDGGPRRYYDQGEGLDVDEALAKDENGNPIETHDIRSSQEAGIERVHVSVQYCIA